MADAPAFVHPTAVVDEGAHVGPGTSIWHFCHVMAGARIGARCTLGQNVFVAATVTMKDGTRIQNNVSIYDGVTLDEDVFLGPSCVFTNVKAPRAALDRRAHVQPTRVRRGATIGANATIVCGVTIGRHAFIGAGAVVTRDVLDYALVLGAPARAAGWVGRHGVRLVDRAGELVCPESGLRYRLEGESVRCLDLDEDAPLPIELGGRR